MKTGAEKLPVNENRTTSSLSSVGQNSATPGFRLQDNRPQAVAQKQRVQALATKPNNTGLPDKLKSGIENLSGHSMDDVKVYYNSAQPVQFNAHAYAQGNQIYIAPGQEKHLPHEAWHVVQQKQGRVKPTMQLKGNVNVNDAAGLEEEADVMGRKASKDNPQNVSQLKTSSVFKYNNQQPIQGKLFINNEKEDGVPLDWNVDGDVEDILLEWIHDETDHHFVDEVSTILAAEKAQKAADRKKIVTAARILNEAGIKHLGYPADLTPAMNEVIEAIQTGDKPLLEAAIKKQSWSCREGAFLILIMSSSEAKRKSYITKIKEDEDNWMEGMESFFVHNFVNGSSNYSGAPSYGLIINIYGTTHSVVYAGGNQVISLNNGGDFQLNDLQVEINALYGSPTAILVKMLGLWYSEQGHTLINEQEFYAKLDEFEKTGNKDLLVPYDLTNKRRVCLVNSSARTHYFNAGIKQGCVSHITPVEANL